MPTYTQLVFPSQRGRSSKFIRFLRAVYRDTRALFKEFQRPLLVFSLAVFGGGWLYHELMGVAGLEQPPLYDMPYIMLALMVFESILDLPTEWYLIIFWYLMPAVAVYIIGQGVADFVRLFFNRGERRDAWEAAVASTYRNHVIVMGAGHVGMRVTRVLVQMGFDVVVIDNGKTPEIEADLKALHIPAIFGDARQEATLETAGLAHADAFVVCTSDDMVNLEVIMTVRDINPKIRIVARMWDNRLTNQLENFMGVDAVLSSSDLSAPAFAGAAVGIEVAQTLRVDDKEYSMIRLKVEAGSFMDGQTVGDLQITQKMDIVLHGRNGGVEVHPSGANVVSAGDTLVIFALHEKIIDIVARNRRAGDVRY